MVHYDAYAKTGRLEVVFKPGGLSCEEFIRQEIEYFERQAAKTREGHSEHLRRMHAFYLGLARRRRQQLARLSHVPPAGAGVPGPGEGGGSAGRLGAG